MSAPRAATESFSDTGQTPPRVRTKALRHIRSERATQDRWVRCHAVGSEADTALEAAAYIGF